MSRKVEVTDAWLKRIIDQVQGLAYGVVQITVHDGQIVQIDRTERSRFDAAKAPSTGAKRK
ncbi:YezD family protein [Paenibacillus soyae]|uniref:YezD family protein n=1 Tax=Paenibacillus soyae TaxID=2969249 RepID=A0A9X2MRZ4_9BACL|nr:YezD family protein [Paenibacillus soyae]MCR2804676.1 YezD family protein [Paenibacillus soyae]